MVGTLSQALLADPAPIGHNEGPPLDPAITWRRHCWRQARATLMKPPPVEIVRRRVRRAAELGMTYQQYASVLVGSGRDVGALLVSGEAAGLGPAGLAPPPKPVAAKLSALTRCRLLLLLAEQARMDADALRERLRSRWGLDFAGVCVAGEQSSLKGACDAIQRVLTPLSLPSDAVVMIGAQPLHARWAEAARLSKFFAGGAYFSAA